MDILLSRYANVDYIMESDIEFGTGMIVEAVRQKKRDEAFMLYSSLYPHMTQETFIPFERFYNPTGTKKAQKPKRAQANYAGGKSKEEIMGMVDEMMRRKSKKEKEV